MGFVLAALVFFAAEAIEKRMPKIEFEYFEDWEAEQFKINAVILAVLLAISLFAAFIFEMKADPNQDIRHTSFFLTLMICSAIGFIWRSKDRIFTIRSE